MENNSASPTSPESPTNSQPSSTHASGGWFPLGRTLLTVLGIAFFGLMGNLIPSIPFALHHMGDRAALLHPPVSVLLATQLGMDLLVAVFLLLALPWVSKQSYRALGFRVPSGPAIALAIGGAIAMIVVVNGSGTIIDSVLHTKHAQIAVQLFSHLREPGVRIQFAIYAIIFGPLAEELAFRIFLFNAFMRSNRYWVPAIASSVLFGAVHGDPYAFVPLALGGLILSGVYYRTSNAWASMVTHAVFNGFSLAVLSFAPQLSH